MKGIIEIIKSMLPSDLAKAVDSKTLDNQEQYALFSFLIKHLNKGGLIAAELVDLQSEQTTDGLTHPFIMSRTNTKSGLPRGRHEPHISYSPYFCDQINFDIAIYRSTLDAYSSINEQRKLKYLDVIESQLITIPSNIITTGFYGVNESETTDPEAYANGEDIKKGWIQKISENTTVLKKTGIEQSYSAHNKVALELKETIATEILNNTQMICVVGDGFEHDGLKNEELFLVRTKKTLANLPTYYIKNMPKNHMMITSKNNLVIFAHPPILLNEMVNLTFVLFTLPETPLSREFSANLTAINPVKLSKLRIF